jgi:hypothetical protein
MIEALPEPRAEPESDSENDSESDSESDSDSDSGGDSRVKDEIHGDDNETTPRDATVEPESIVSAPSSPQPEPPTSTRPLRNQKAPFRLDPGTYISTKHEASHVYKVDTTIWNESTSA